MCTLARLDEGGEQPRVVEQVVDATVAERGLGAFKRVARSASDQPERELRIVAPESLPNIGNDHFASTSSCPRDNTRDVPV